MNQDKKRQELQEFENIGELMPIFSNLGLTFESGEHGEILVSSDRTIWVSSASKAISVKGMSIFVLPVYLELDVEVFDFLLNTYPDEVLAQPMKEALEFNEQHIGSHEKYIECLNKRFGEPKVSEFRGIKQQENLLANLSDFGRVKQQGSLLFNHSEWIVGAVVVAAVGIYAMSNRSSEEPQDNYTDNNGDTSIPSGGYFS